MSTKAKTATTMAMDAIHNRPGHATPDEAGRVPGIGVAGAAIGGAVGRTVGLAVVRAPVAVIAATGVAGFTVAGGAPFR
jgi:hypothetical protein